MSDQNPQPETLESAIQELGLSIVAEFVPFSQSRNAKKPIKNLSDRSLNWRVKLIRDGRTILETDYQAGIAYCLTYKAELKHRFRPTLAFAEAIAKECETGRRASLSNRLFSGEKHPGPLARDVIYSLIMDSSVIDHASFESWASDFGYDPDSRSAESIYRACLETALTLRAGLGEDGLRKLQEASQDY